MHQAFENKSLEELTPEEFRRREIEKIHKLHRGHDVMHAEMLIVFFVCIFAAQIGLVQWKKRWPKSYKLVTLIGMWILPMGMSLKNHWWRFIFFWLVFSCITAFIVKKAVEKPCQGTTPRLVYKWFYLIYRASFTLAFIGYSVFIFSIFGLNIILRISSYISADGGLVLLFYGLYYGVLGLDLAEISSDKMATHIGYYSQDGMPTRTLDKNICAVCGNNVLVSSDEEGLVENTYKLPCQHVFHEFCIRGWCIVGKKQICPYCKEKVDLKRMFSNPWEKSHHAMLDWLRLLLAWQPVIFGIIQAINYILGLH